MGGRLHDNDAEIALTSGRWSIGPDFLLPVISFTSVDWGVTSLVSAFPSSDILGWEALFLFSPSMFWLALSFPRALSCLNWGAASLFGVFSFGGVVLQSGIFSLLGNGFFSFLSCGVLSFLNCGVFSLEGGDVFSLLSSGVFSFLDWEILSLLFLLAATFSCVIRRLVTKKQIFYVQADRKSWPPLYDQLFVIFLLVFFWPDYMCSETDFTQEKVNFHATFGIPNSSS